MEQNYNAKMSGLGYNHLVCDIFTNWEDVKDEILIPERKEGEGNGTIHVFLGAADKELQNEFADYYHAVNNGEDPSVGAVKVKHYFLASNIISMLGYLCQYDYEKNIDFSDSIRKILNFINENHVENGMLSTYSFFKLSTGSSKLRPYFKQFEKRGVFTDLIRQILLPNSSYKISLYKNDNGEYAAFWLIGFNWQNDFEADTSAEHLHKKKEDSKQSELPLQVIYYGAPGTGKSHTIKEHTDGKNVIRTTFHPDSDYSTFVGAYKPTTVNEQVMTVIGTKAVPVENPDGSERTESKIVYEFVPQAFLQAYVNAWKMFVNAGENEIPEEQYLIIEEINRGNCAQIFGDLFQLLDRNDEGYSEYPITADKDMEKYLSEAFEGIAIPNEEKLANMFGDQFVAQKIALGQELVLPPNLFIWATMNTSDQSLFPIDSAFKRRWDWKYIPISEAVDDTTKEPKGWKIHADGKDYDWWKFLQAINEQIGQLTNSQDKKLGYFFCKAKDGRIDAETLADKVLFFLYNEVLKDFEKEQDFLKKADGTYLEFDEFYKVNEFGKTEIQEDKVVRLLENLGLEGSENDDEIKPVDAEDSSNEHDTSVLDKYLDFWSKYHDSYENAEEYKELFTNPKGLRQNWYNIGGVNRPYYIGLSVNYRARNIRMQVYFRQDHDSAVLEKYMDNKDRISEALGQEVSTSAGSKYTYFQIVKDFDMDKNDWNEAFGWYHEKCVKFKHLADEIDPK